MATGPRSTFAVVVIVIGLAPARADYVEGVQAFDGGDYETAAAEWRPVAESGDADAQVALAGLYASGLGVRQSYRRAAEWYRRAAERGHVIAQLNLGDYYGAGRGVAADPVEAYLWLDLAARQGNDWAAERRDGIAAAMSEREIEQAQRRVLRWRRRGAN